ncbi:N-acetyltransferase [Roseovarius faecimaris]|uniref:N-acetyltransferase n=1 Tax=Roseovarius faecimaris TaxID=2494550 RepID=A0A6I6IW23_9RHOB|nr:GNAT family N-acetyltransferase [Roseovarius faecimaris]QGX99616.1 N-acetyltransferase [Roseovarius faecimaris]
MTALPELTTERLTLRAPTPDDLPAYRAFYAASDATVGAYRGQRSADEVAAIHAADMAHWKAKGFGVWLLRRIGDETVLGGAGLVRDDDWPSHELTWWLMPAVRGKGFASEASRAIIAYAYDTLGWDQVRTFMRDHNTPAHRLAQRLGGTRIDRQVFPDGVTRDIYAFPRETAL